jgi:putative phosphoribosyl transferase
MIETGYKFADRKAAGRALARELASREFRDPMVLALPRGGVPVAAEVARTLHAPLDLVMVRKIGAPGQPEFAIGAVVDGEDPQVVIDEQAAGLAGANKAYIAQRVDEAIGEIARRRAVYGAQRPIPLAGNTAIIVDDGIATGSTVKAALHAVRAAHPSCIVLAVPVAPMSALARLAPLCDEIVCLLQPRQFYAVGAHYEDFGQTSDQEVVRDLEAARKLNSQSGR